MRKIIIIVLALAVVLGFLFWKFAPNIFERKSEAQKEITLTISALWENEDLIKPALEAYHKDHPNVTLNYKYQSSTNYRSRIQAQIDDPAEGVDIFLIHNTWLPIFLKNKQLAPAPESMSLDEYQKTFYPIVKESLVAGDKIYGIPRGVDGLALYYNEDILKATGESVPQTWDQFIDSARRLTVKDTAGKIQTAGAALGTTGNVDHWSDIIGLLFLQNPGSKLEAPGDAAGAEVLKFYTSFVTDPKNPVWNSTFEHSTDAFAQGKVAYYFAPSWRSAELREKNPQLNFQVAPVPQIPGSGRNVGWGTFWAYAVSGKSPNATAAWEFLRYLTSKEVAKLLYQEAAKVRLIGLPYSRLDLQQELVNDLLAGPFVTQAPIYKSWYLSSDTHDAGLNDNIIKYYEDAVNATVQGGDPVAALETTQKGIEQVLSDYAPSPVPTAK